MDLETYTQKRTWIYKITFVYSVHKLKNKSYVKYQFKRVSNQNTN